MAAWYTCKVVPGTQLAIRYLGADSKMWMKVTVLVISTWMEKTRYIVGSDDFRSTIVYVLFSMVRLPEYPQKSLPS
jgi:hypothetical protein